MQEMLNMDFDHKVVINYADNDWLASPAAGVWRKPLEREHKESGHVTSIVKYEAGTSFSEHFHPFGEEIFVLDGVFSDENGDYPKGSYIRNPPGSSHAPFSKEGCILFVKLNQFSETDTQQIVLQTEQHAWLPGQGKLQVMPLHQHEHEQVALVKWPSGEKFQAHQHYGGEEILVLSGQFEDEHGSYPELSWIRSPHLSQHRPFVNTETIIYVKTGHLSKFI